MKSTDLAKLNANKIQSRMKGAGTPERFRKGAGPDASRATVNPLIENLLKKGLGPQESE
jgi:hypothetical protein